MTNEIFQPTLDYPQRTPSAKFNYQKRQEAEAMLRELEDPDFSAYPEHDRPTQARLDELRHYSKDPEYLDRRVARLIERQRVPFGDQQVVETGHASLVEELVGFNIADYPWQEAVFFEFTANPGYRVVKGKTPKRRKVQAPMPVMERFHTNGFLPWAKEHFEVHDSAYGLAGDRSYVDAVTPHAGNRYFLTADIKGAYQHVDPMQLAYALSQGEGSSAGPLGWYPIVKRFFMPQGANTGIATGANSSPLLFNIHLGRFDEAMATYCEAYGMTYTRYMDDCIFSAPDTGDPNYDPIGRRKAAFFKRGLRAMGMGVNQHKVRYKDLESDGPVMLPGCQLDASGLWRIPEYAEANMHKYFQKIGRMITEKEVLTKEEVGTVHGIHGYTMEFVYRRLRQTDDVYSCGNDDMMNFLFKLERKDFAEFVLSEQDGGEAAQSMLHPSELNLALSYRALAARLRHATVAD